MEILDGSRNLTQQLTYELGKAIVQGKYIADAAFPTEAELSTQFNISRSVTREAVKMLTAKGLISSRPRKGIRVQPPSSWNMFDTDVLNWTLSSKPSLLMLREFLQMRLGIEPEAVALACRNASEDQLSAMKAALERVEFAKQGEDNLLESEVQYRVRILDASGNRFFIQFCGFIQASLRISNACISQLKGQQPLPFLDHQAVYQCIADKDADAGRSLVRAYLEKALEIVDDSIASHSSPLGVTEKAITA